MRLALVTDTYLPEVNGVTTVLDVMRRGLLARGHTVLVCAPSYPEGQLPDPGVLRRPSIPCPGYPNVRLSSPFGSDVTPVLESFAPDVVHVVTEGPLGAIGRRFARRRRLPLVTSFHTDFPRYASKYLGAWAAAPTRMFLRRFHSLAALTQTPSEETQRELRELGVPNPVVWGRGVDSALFTPGRRSDTRRMAMGATSDMPLVLHVSRLAVEKDVDTLVGAFQRAHTQMRESVRFAVAGDGPRGAWVREQLPFAEHFGFLARGRLAELYADADLFVFPSPTETCGLVALEAMAAGLPVIAADQGGVLENLRDGLNGRTVAAGNAEQFAAAIVTLAGDAEQRGAMAQAARAFAVARDWEHELDALEPMYREVMLGRGSRAPTPAPVGSLAGKAM